ncbi:hypothetical protein F8M41_019228 [Gigaspora margarita]|uniref:Uncharacterized protein n=1 Tax=Gigaspora margarita TaxID=4874 RepID=A0A8H4AKA1_GIGMA|nr:hypothetical protein F8M41_019228 [Gigaspora margarita]
MPSPNSRCSCSLGCNCDGCNNEQLFLYKSLLVSSDSHYEVLESFVLFLWNHSEFNLLHDLYSEFLSLHYPTLPEHLPFSSEYFNDSNLTSQVSFRDFDELRNAHSEGYPITPPSESFESESSSNDSEMHSLSQALENYRFDDSNSDIEISCEYMDNNPQFYCGTCEYPSFECVCCRHCNSTPFDCSCDFSLNKVLDKPIDSKFVCNSCYNPCYNSSFCIRCNIFIDCDSSDSYFSDNNSLEFDYNSD